MIFNSLKDISNELNLKIIKKEDIFNNKILKDMNIYDTYSINWYIFLNKEESPNYYEKYSYYTCCFTGQKYRKFGSSQLEWSANCHIFIKCSNPNCNNW